MTYERPTNYESSSHERAHGFYSTQYGDGFEDAMTRGKLRNYQAPAAPDNLDSEERREFFREGAYPYKRKISLDAYYEHKFPLQIELVKMQNWVRDTGEKIVIVFEGRDAAGKGGTIRRFMEHLNPRAAKVIALEKPSSEEAGQWYFQRYVRHLPTAGEIALFDRSWYNRAGVEKVMGFCTEEQYQEFLRVTPLVEEMWANSGVRIIKLYFSVSRVEQERRFKRRQRDPLKQWKLSSIDLASYHRWDEYTEAKETMFYHTHTDFAPWYVIKSDDKMRARINAIRHVLDLVPYHGKEQQVVYQADPWIIASADEAFDVKGKPRHEAVSNGSTASEQLATVAN
jgi:polyphosphate kinase 2